MLFGLILLLILSSLSVIIALGKIEEATSHGLMPLVTSLSTLAGGFAQWAFSNTRATSPEPKNNNNHVELPPPIK